MDDEEPVKPEFYSLTTDAGEKKTSNGFSGKGTAAYTNGDVYEGPFVNGVRQGSGGVYKYVKGDQFEGTFENNEKTGMGRVTYKKGGFYHGFFQSGKREGEGTFKYDNGDIYSGEWKAGKKHGKGTYVFNGTKYAYTGEWKDGHILTGAWTLTDGTKYLGGFQNQKPCGDGIWQTAKGTIVEGAYMQQVVPIDSDKPKPGVPPRTETKIYWKIATMVGVDDD